MRIMIRGCNNPKCKWFHKGQCDMPAGFVHDFDYDHEKGRLYCKMEDK